VSYREGPGEGEPDAAVLTDEAIRAIEAQKTERHRNSNLAFVATCAVIGLSLVLARGCEAGNVVTARNEGWREGFAQGEARGLRRCVGER
jgi:hypothetical protein